MASHYDASAAPTIWRMPEDLWTACRALLPAEKPLGTRGRPVVPFRRVLDGILHVLRTGCQWKAVPREFGAGSTIHARFQAWTQQGVWKRLWAGQLRHYDAAHQIGWTWQVTDSATVPSPPRRRRDGPRSDQSRQAGHQAACAERSPRRSLGRGPQRCQPHRYEAGRSHLGQHGSPAASAHARPPAAPVSGQRLRLR
jgi:transposase